MIYSKKADDRQKNGQEKIHLPSMILLGLNGIIASGIFLLPGDAYHTMETGMRNTKRVRRTLFRRYTMRVAICDDEKTALESLRLLLEQRSIISLIRSFLSSERLHDAILDGEYFDIVFMDIDWNQSRNGIDFASELNKISPCTQIIFVTGYNDRFSQHIFLKQINLCGYLIKPIDSALLDETLRKAFRAVQELAEQKLLISHKSMVHAIPFRSICYLESQGHKLLIHTTTKELIVCNERLEELKNRLPGNFFQCHKSFVVNFDYIQRVESKQVILKSNEEIPISKAKYTKTRSAYFYYMGEMM